MPISLRPFSPSDRFLLSRWLRDADTIAHVGPRAAVDAEIALAQSSPSSLIRIVLGAGQPIGYAHAFDSGLAANPPARVPAGSYQAAVLIGSPPHRAGDAEAGALRMLADEVFAHTLAVAVAVYVPVRDEAAMRRIERAGFTWRAIEHDPSVGPLWILTRERP